jgi:hypothetical protein
MNATTARPFLVIGAMKSGTTSLYHDLSRLEAVGTNPTKEPDLFTHERPDSQIQRDVRRFLTGNTGWLGDFSTSYTMAGLFPGVPERAHRILGDDVPIFYLVRNPIVRAISHHHHWLARGMTSSDVDKALKEDPAFLDVSSYGHQLQLWAQVFGSNKVRVIVFEEYIAHRAETIRLIAEALQVPAPSSPPGEEVHNSNAGERVARGIVSQIVSARAYRLIARQRIPASLRHVIGGYLLKDAGPRQYPSASTLHWFREALRPDVELLTNTMQWGNPAWDLDATVSRLLAERSK